MDNEKEKELETWQYKRIEWLEWKDAPMELFTGYDFESFTRLNENQGFITRIQPLTPAPLSEQKQEGERELLKLGIEAIALIKADGLFNQDIEMGRADALDETEPITMEQLIEMDGDQATDSTLKWYNEVLVPREKARLHKQALYVATGILKYLKENKIL